MAALLRLRLGESLQSWTPWTSGGNQGPSHSASSQFVGDKDVT